jgi:hypothetical protein
MNLFVGFVKDIIAIETLDTAAILKSEKNSSPAQAGLFDLA